MLYVSTRNMADSYTVYRAIHEDRAPDGGVFVPFRMPVLSTEELEELKEKSFSETVAHILNLFFSKQLSGWDVEFCIGRYPFKLEMLNQRVVIAELWHNTGADYAHMVHCLYEKLCSGDAASKQPTQWVRIVVEIAVLFGLFGELSKNRIESADVAVTAGDFIYAISAWYASQMGLPIGCIICGCNENGAVWDLVHRGELNAEATLIHTSIPELDVSCHEGLERLIYGTLGPDEVHKYVYSCAEYGIYQPPEGSLSILNEGITAAVIGESRIDSVISSTYRTNNYLMDPMTAVSLGALQDHRARTGENRHTLLLSRKTPLSSAPRVAAAIGCSQEKLKAMIRMSRE